MYCIKCGRKINDRADYCKYCGAPQDEYDPQELSDDYDDYDTNEIPEQYERYDSRVIPDRYARNDSRKPPKRQHFPFGILFVAVLTISAFLLIVFFPKELAPKLNSFNMPSVIEDALDTIKEKTGLGQSDAEENADTATDDGTDVGYKDPLIGVYKAVSAVVGDKTIEGPALLLANISFKVESDGIFTAKIQGETYSGSWYKDQDYVELYTDQGDYAFTGTFSDDILSLSDDTNGISVTLKKK